MAVILGLNAYHGDSAACVVVDGDVVAAAEEERFRRVKHWAGFPEQAVRACLADAGIGFAEVDAVAVNRDPRANLGHKLAYVATHVPNPAQLAARVRNQMSWASLDKRLADSFGAEGLRAPLHRIEHHRAHLASCFLASPFDHAVAVSIDGFGDFASAAWGVGRGTQVAVEGRVLFPHSLGIFYEALTQYIGFPHYGDEYKVMGLAPYGEPSLMDAMRQIVQVRPDGTFRLNLRFFRHHRENVGYEWRDTMPTIGTLYSPALEALLGSARAPDEPLEQRHKDVAASTQAMFEEAAFALLGRLARDSGTTDLTLAGGCAYNSVANGKVRAATPFRRLYLPSAAGDAGGAIGAALALWYEQNPSAPRRPIGNAYLGPSFGPDDVAALLDAHAEELAAQHCRTEAVAGEGALCRRTATAIAEGKVVGWFQGRMEWGPRALGNRSILCDPRRADMKDILNSKIKRRKSFRPFAPSILREAVGDWLEEVDDVPFMMKVYPVRAEKRSQIPAVTHVDGSGRLQTVTTEGNPRYHRLIYAFAAETGVPCLLNTSFNENEPIVCRPQEALDCFLRTNMDVLVLNDHVVSRGG